MKSALISLLLSVAAVIGAPPPFLFPGAVRIERDGASWIVLRSDGSRKRAEVSDHEITFDGSQWRKGSNSERWQDLYGDTWVLSGSTWTLDRRASLRLNGREATLIDSGFKYSWDGDVHGCWSLVKTVRAVPEGVKATGTVQDMFSRKLASIRRSSGIK